MSYRKGVLLVCLVPVLWATAANAQVNFSSTRSTGSRTGGFSWGPCSYYPKSYRYVGGSGSVTPATNVQSLVVAINMSPGDPDLVALPSSVVITGNPTGADAPHGIEPYRGGSPCWWSGGPKWPENGTTDLINSIINAPGNPVPPGTGVWRAFEIPLTDEVLEEGWVQTYFNLKHRGTGGQVLQAVNGMASAVIPAPPPTGAASARSDTSWAFCPGNAWWDISSMSFTQYPDTHGVDVDFTYPKMVVDDFVATETTTVRQVKFWFSAEGDGFDPWGDLPSQISNIHLRFYNGPRGGDQDSLVETYDYAPNASNVSIVEYTQGLQDWCALPDSIFIPGDHTKVFECTIDILESYFDCYADSLYSLGISIATDDSTSPAIRLGWKSSDLDRYPPGFTGEHFHNTTALRYALVDTCIDGECPDLPGYFCYGGEGIDMAFAINHVIVPPDEPVCGDGVWDETENCGVDCWNDIGYAEMNHDCTTDFLDVLEFARYFHGEMLYSTSADFDGDDDVDLVDFSIFATKYGLTATPCSSAPMPRPSCQGTIALSADSNSTISSTTMPQGLNSIYIIVEDWEDAAVMEYGLETSSNIVILNQTVLTPVSPISVTCDIGAQQNYRVYTTVSGSWQSGRVVWAKVDLMVTDVLPAWAQITTNAPCKSHRIRWAKDSLGRSYDFMSASNLGINGGAVPTTSTTCTLVGVDGGSAPVAHRLGQNYPNPFNPSTIIPYQLSEPAHVNITIYNVRGERIRTLVDRHKPEGWFDVDWDGTNARGERVASGIYFYRMQAGSFVQTKKLVLLK